MMYTQCSECATVYRVRPEQLRAAQGLVRCSLCDQVFSALEGLRDDLPDAAAAEANPASVDASAVATDPFSDPFAPPIRPLHQSLLSTLREQRTTIGWSLAIMLLVVLLLAQYGYMMRNDLARYPQARPWLEAVCQVADCRLLPRREVSQIQILDRHVKVHPDYDDALLVDASFSNRADYVQPFPQIRLTLFDHEGRVTGHRWFLPDEYLRYERDRERVRDGMTPHEAFSIRLELVNPGSSSDSFEFDFR